MRNAWRVFARDVARLARVRKAWIILLGVLITPSLYAWFNIAAFWDPYSSTENIAVAVVNQDEGATSEATGPIDIGDQLVDQLRQNDELGWQFLDEDEAMSAVRSGSVYATIIVPPDFSRDFASITSGEMTRPELTYYVNEKANAIAPKITDVGASTLDTQVNSTFVSVVAEVVADQLRGAGEDAEDRLLDAKTSTVTALDEAVDSVSSARGRVADLTSGLADARGTLDSAADTLGTVDTTLGDVQTAVGQAEALVADAQDELVDFTDSITSAYVSGATQLADASSTLSGAVTTVTDGVTRVNTAVGDAIDDVTQVIDTNGEVLAQLESLAGEADDGSELASRLHDAITALQERNSDDHDVLTALQGLNTDVTDAADAIRDSADALDTAASDAASSAQSVRDVLLASGPALNDALSRLSSSAGALSSSIDAQRAQLTQARDLLTSLGDQLGGTSDALDSFDGNLADAETGLETVRTDVVALGTADAWNKLETLTGLNAEQIAQFMASPVEVDQHTLFPVASYGSAMAPLFMNLSLWIGAFVLVVILKLEVDREGVENLTVRQAYLGRWMLMAALTVLQAVILCVGTLVIGVETVSVAAFIGTGVLLGLAYLSIIYALSVAFGYVGKGLCILLVIMQIPGASGIYPIEMMPGFFRALYPFFPFTYGIDAVRETISGFYDGHYLHALAILALFVALAFVLGLLLRERLGNFTLLFSRRIAATQLLATEDVHLVDRRYRLSQVIRALSNREDYRADLTDKAARFGRRYPTLLRAALVIALVVMVALGLVAWLAPVDKAALLGVWVLCSLLIIGFLVALEYVRQSFEFAGDVGDMSEGDLQRTLVNEGAAPTAREAGGADDADAAGADAATDATADAGGERS